ncbi:carbohydrate ABC transporter permease [Microbacterium sulfonylureivorans]|uniref:carbohydrate ABC transporter permease n=1 Tax=Microbacterium sulfonylureivorans TaxID=2486854 RepID=UPI000FDB1B44|nr:carbohydrate ABC transporter permease [Microbacterium sulfonylureivorans]
MTTRRASKVTAPQRPPVSLKYGSARTGASVGSRAVVNAFLVIGTIYMVFPVTWLFFASTKNVEQLYSTNIFDMAEFNLFANIADVAAQNDGIFFRWMANSVLYASVGAIVGGMIAVAAGYAFDKFRFRGRNMLFAFVLVGVLIPNTAIVLPLYMLFAPLGLTNTMWAILLPALCNPFSVYLARIYSQGYIPDETLEAARVDGAGPIRSFFSVGLPMIMPGFITIALFQFVAVWNNYMLPLVMLTSERIFPVSLGMSLWQSYTRSNTEFAPLVITGSLLSIIPLIIAFVLLQRYWRAGMTEGAVK